ncbi:hypothetical protein GYMLUDRAFT_611792 [Collybiopsis luxurians FD-317 M1]|uniref:Uncharacterized protein n=1 Tax=Collybiopsis luxurians FD-317 M1 TaxID=944289 RepID=A0A0D0CWP6_9AGAR|nr:hypothetical protein GYMLUDRAFT_611792 [Collybiopsis luxurians FD-317 M1]
MGEWIGTSQPPEPVPTVGHPVRLGRHKAQHRRTGLVSTHRFLQEKAIMRTPKLYERVKRIQTLLLSNGGAENDLSPHMHLRCAHNVPRRCGSTRRWVWCLVASQRKLRARRRWRVSFVPALTIDTAINGQGKDEAYRSYLYSDKLPTDKGL